MLTIILAITVLAAVLVIGYLLTLQRPPLSIATDESDPTAKPAFAKPPVDDDGTDLSASEGGTEFLYLGLDDVAIRVAEQPDGTGTLWWTDGVANDWAETYKDVATAVLRLAVLLACRQTDWVAGFATDPAEFARSAYGFFDDHANTRVVEPRKPVDNEVVSLDSHGRPILTVGQLRQITAALDPAEHVIIDDPANDWYLNIASVGIPDADRDPWTAVTFIAGDTFDSRQF